MPEIYTDEVLILFIYNELTSEQHNVIQEALQVNPDLYRRFDELLRTMAQLDTLRLDPHPSSVEIILEQSAHPEHSI
jgi:hypothetical protein